MCTAICTVALLKLNDSRQRQFTTELDVLCMCAPIKTHHTFTCNYMYWGKELLTQQLTGSSTQTQACDNAMSMAIYRLLSKGSNLGQQLFQ